MGDEPTPVTLDTGEAAIEYPDGRTVLAPVNRLAQMSQGRREANEEAAAALTNELVARAEEKREKQLSGTPVPPDKTVL